LKIELLNDMYLEPQKSRGYSLYKRYTTAKGEPRRKRIAYAGDLEQAVKSFLQAVQYEELKDLHTVFDGYVKRVEECNRETVMRIVEKVEQELKSE
jgi:hypothetical protein